VRVAAVEALGNAAGDAALMLVSYAADTDPEVRGAAAWALGSGETQGNVGAELLQLLQTEQDPEVRSRLYHALGNQEQFNLAAAIRLAQNETQTDVRTAALDLLAQTYQNRPSPELLVYFDQSAVPVLRSTALQAENTYERMNAVLALRRAMTSQSVGALEEITRQSNDPKIMEAAAKALQASRPR
jgi:HEAT repeat protein